MMLAADTCVIIDYLQGVRSIHVDFFKNALMANILTVSPVVIHELMSNPKPHTNLSPIYSQLGVLEIEDFGYWERAGRLRAKIRAQGLKATASDALIAQSCIDHDVPLLTTDDDFRHYAKVGGLKLAIAP